MKLAFTRQQFTRNVHTEFYGNPTNGLVAVTRGQMDRRGHHIRRSVFFGGRVGGEERLVTNSICDSERSQSSKKTCLCKSDSVMLSSGKVLCVERAGYLIS